MIQKALHIANRQSSRTFCAYNYSIEDQKLIYPQTSETVCRDEFDV